MRILVTGGAGYIGSHTIIELVKEGHDVVVVDNLSNSSRESIRRVEAITNSKTPFYKIDLRNIKKLEKVFTDYNFDGVIHFAGLKAVHESVEKPLLYYDNNLISTISLLKLVEKYGTKKFVFSSSATVYGNAPIPYVETGLTGQGITNPYGKTKYMIEHKIRDVSRNHPDIIYTILRYFNPVGAHESGLIGEDPKGRPNNLMPYISRVASGKLDKLTIFGNDYPTYDGTCIRDYIHVVDLARGHVAALEKSPAGYNVYNLGSGVGTSVLELVNTFIETTGQNIPYEIGAKRPGDLPEYFADSKKAFEELGWKAEKTVEDMCRDAWRWQSKNPDGYAS